MVYRKWQIPAPAPQQAGQLSQQLGISPLLAQVLTARGCSRPEQAALLLGEGEALSDPMLMRDMDLLVERVHRAVDNGEKIVIYGDYDVDGVTATALMLSYLESVGATVFYKLPSREGDGYGLSRDVVDLLVKKNVQLVLTVDNGISALEEAEYAAEQGLDLIITDHHLPPPVLPKALAVVDPLRRDDESPAKNLSGVGVAFKVICALEGCSPEELLPYYGDLVAVGTVADMMALTGENRTLVRQGVECLETTQHIGLQALLAGCGLENKPLSAENISFGLAPRLNAAGRMEKPDDALQLLLTEDEEEAEALVEQLNVYNTQRQAIEQGIADELTARIDADPVAARRPILVVWGHGYHQGVIGIVASRLVERYGKPAIVCTIDESGQVRGSGRSFAGFSLYSAIAACSDLLERFGGHDLAAGLSMQEKDLPAFVEKINGYASRCCIEAPPLAVDGEFHPERVSVDDVDSLMLLAPFGNGNPSPVFLFAGARIEGIYPVSEGRHVRIRLSKGSASFQAVLFGTSPAQLPYRVGDTVDAVLALSVYRTGIQASVSGRIKELRPAALGENYLEEHLLFSRFISGAQLDAQQKRQLCPGREDVIRVWREIGAGGVSLRDLRPLLLRCGASRQGAGRVFAAVEILQELAHVAADPAGMLAPTGGQKRALTESELLKKLEG
ncbi:MAG: single-stranded-DNA-specific exonuclease RecJ [Oscillospiraceae bacterium]|nr:single-stranded-DNA-specific exonuclease RecJ [Oscillospiraceae bacterium]